MHFQLEKFQAEKIQTETFDSRTWFKLNAIRILRFMVLNECQNVDKPWAIHQTEELFDVY